MKKIIITNLYNNVDIPQDFRNLWQKEFLNLAQASGADFHNFSQGESNAVSMKYIPLFEKYSIKDQDSKASQLALLDKTDDLFAQGYDWVMGLDADMIFDPRAKNLLDKLNEDTVYFGGGGVFLKQGKKAGGKVKFESNLKDEFLKDNELKYGNQGVFCLNRSIWQKVKNVIMNPEKHLMQHCKPGSERDIFSHVDQNIFSIAATIKKIKTDIFPQMKILVHLLPPCHEKYKRISGITEDFIETSLSGLEHLRPKHQKWIALLTHYLSLERKGKEFLFDAWHRRK